MINEMPLKDWVHLRRLTETSHYWDTGTGWIKDTAAGTMMYDTTEKVTGSGALRLGIPADGDTIAASVVPGTLNLSADLISFWVMSPTWEAVEWAELRAFSSTDVWASPENYFGLNIKKYLGFAYTNNVWIYIEAARSDFDVFGTVSWSSIKALQFRASGSAGDILFNALETRPTSLEPPISIYPATGVTIQRGGARSGLGIKTDVGLMSFRMYNDEDPMNGGTFQPGQIIQALASSPWVGPDVLARPGFNYYYGWEALDPSWTVDVVGYYERATWAALEGAYGLYVEGNANTTANIWRKFDALIPGVEYTVTLKVYCADPTVTVNLVGTDIPMTDTGISTLSAKFIATDLVQDLEVKISSSSGNSFNVNMDAFNVNIYKEGPDIPGSPRPIFTGRVVDVESSYPLMKDSGEQRSYTTITVADAVQLHTTTQRYGVSIAEGYETFEARIGRLAASAVAPIETPVQGGPREVYVL